MFQCTPIRVCVGSIDSVKDLMAYLYTFLSIYFISCGHHIRKIILPNNISRCILSFKLVYFNVNLTQCEGGGKGKAVRDVNCVKGHGAANFEVTTWGSM